MTPLQEKNIKAKEENVKAIEEEVSKILDVYFNKVSAITLLGANYENFSRDKKEENSNGVRACRFQLVDRDKLSEDYEYYNINLVIDIIESIEANIFTGKNTHDTSDIAELKEIALCKNGFVIPAGSDPLSDFYYAIHNTKEEDVKVLLSNVGFFHLSKNIKEKDEKRKLFSIEDVIAAKSETLGYDNFHPRQGKLIENGVQFIAGDFSKINISIDKVVYKEYEQGFFEGVNLLEENKVLAVAEVFWKVDINGEIADNFVVVKENPNV